MALKERAKTERKPKTKEEEEEESGGGF